MFRFAMQLDHCQHRSELQSQGIHEDVAFESWRLLNFYTAHPDFEAYALGVPTVAHAEHRRLIQEKVFRWESKKPKTAREAEEMVRDVFGYGPARVWVQGEESARAESRPGFLSRLAG